MTKPNELILISNGQDLVMPEAGRNVLADAPASRATARRVNAINRLHEQIELQLTDAVRGCLKTGGYARKEHDAESGGCFLVGYRGNLYLIGSDYQVGRPSPGYDAVGCGGDVALGALFASSGPPSKRVKTALRAAASHNAGVRGPFKVVSA